MRAQLVRLRTSVCLSVHGVQVCDDVHAAAAAACLPAVYNRKNCFRLTKADELYLLLPTTMLTATGMHVHSFALFYSIVLEF